MDPEGTDEEYYRYEVLKDCNLEWLDKVCALGINPDVSGNDKFVTVAPYQTMNKAFSLTFRSFVTGVGHYWDCGQIDVSRGDDPNVPFYNGASDIPMTAYHDFSEIGLRHVFPFHTICYQDILQRCIGQQSPDQIKRDVLFEVMENLNGGQYVRLQLSYGQPEPLAEQVWHHPRGEESLVVNPVTIPDLDSDLDLIMNSLDKKARPDRNPPGEDIFSKLPVELRHEIFELLPAGSILALKAASSTMHTTTLRAELWKQRLRREIPWLWEIHDVDVFQSQYFEGKTSKLLLDIEKKSLIAVLKNLPKMVDDFVGLRKLSLGILEE
ncbi:hypothetical protein LT330_010349 [Penicillium expansum]|nr:hypothetical protein LT330_010349 [Penicillium expansum]